jgi:hypothetical protein
MRHSNALSLHPHVSPRRVMLYAVLPLILFLTACTTSGFTNDRTRDETAAPAVDRVVLSATVLSGYLEFLQRLVQAAPAEQAELMAATQREFEIAPTPSHQLRYALALSVPGHPATDLPQAQRLLRELMATPETLLPAERSLAFLELQQVAAQLTLTAENRRLQSSASRAANDRNNAETKRLQAAIDENAKLRKDLEDARAKLEAISDIERSLSERKTPQPTSPPTTSSEGRNP